METLHPAYQLLAACHDETRARLDLAPERTVLGGFSMGAVMSYALALGPGRPAPVGLAAFSGLVPAVAGWQDDLPRPTRTLVAHGRRDPVIGVELGRRAARLLRETRLAVE